MLEVASPSFPPADSQSDGFLSLERASGKKPLQAIATPMPDSLRLRSGGDLMLLVTDPERPFSFPDDALHALYGLTPAEIEVADGLLMGYSTEEISCLRRVSPATVCQQVKSMLSKTEASRQSEMVRLLMTLPQTPVQTA
jgi:DNA-binding CsgD family transcriptional regulator